jgi:hypothetical protein
VASASDKRAKAKRYVSCTMRQAPSGRRINKRLKAVSRRAFGRSWSWLFLFLGTHWLLGCSRLDGRRSGEALGHLSRNPPLPPCTPTAHLGVCVSAKKPG